MLVESLSDYRDTERVAIFVIKCVVFHQGLRALVPKFMLHATLLQLCSLWSGYFLGARSPGCPELFLLTHLHANGWTAAEGGRGPHRRGPDDDRSYVLRTDRSNVVYFQCLVGLESLYGRGLEVQSTVHRIVASLSDSKNPTAVHHSVSVVSNFCSFRPLCLD